MYYSYLDIEISAEGAPRPYWAELRWYAQIMHKETVVSANSFDARSTLRVGDESYEIFRLDKVEGSARLPYSLKVLLENLLRTEDGANITADHIRALGNWDASAQPSQPDPLANNVVTAPSAARAAAIASWCRSLSAICTVVPPWSIRRAANSHNSRTRSAPWHGTTSHATTQLKG